MCIPFSMTFKYECDVIVLRNNTDKYQIELMQSKHHTESSHTG